MQKTVAFTEEQAYNKKTKSSHRRVKCCETGRCSQTKGFSCGAMARPLKTRNALNFADLSISGGFFMLKEESFKHHSAKRTLLSPFLAGKTRSKIIAYTAIVAAVCIVANTFLEIKFSDVQFSFTIYVSILSGILIGPFLGFGAVFLGDFVGYLLNNWGFVYMPWVGLSSAAFALIAGLLMNGVRLSFRGGTYVKLALVCVLSFLVCTAGINTLGFYFYNKGAFSPAVIEYFEAEFGGVASYFAYLCYRLFFKLQILNSLLNYALLFLTVPILNSVKALRVKIE